MAHELYYAAIKADENLSEALVKEFGETKASTERYKMINEGHPVLGPYFQAKRKADRELHADTSKRWARESGVVA